MLGMKRILVPVDFSEDSEYAIQRAVEIARENGGRLFVLHVVGATSTADRDAFPIDPLMARPHPSLLRDSEARMRAMLGDDAALVAQYHTAVGDPGDEIVAWARKTRADVVVLATHGHRGLKRYLLGSIADEVVRRSPCMVLVVRHPKRVSATEPALSGRT